MMLDKTLIEILLALIHLILDEKRVGEKIVRPFLKNRKELNGMTIAARKPFVFR